MLKNELALRVSRDGLSASVPFHGLHEANWRFDIAARRLVVSAAENKELLEPELRSQVAAVANWINSEAPTLNGVRIQLTPGERAQALAIAPSGDRFLLGGDYYLRFFDSKGVLLWVQPGPGACWRVNISRDGRLAVAAFDDGTVRWYDLRNGNELLALFVSNEPDNPRWVAWTPSGYYDASPGAEDFIGWHVNQGADEAGSFFPASRFRDLYYRPDAIQDVLVSLAVKERPTRRELLAAAPPVVKILGRQTLPNGDVAVDYIVESIFDEPADVDIFVDDAKLDDDGARVAAPINERQTLTVPRGSCADTIAIVARAQDGRASNAALVERTARIGDVCETGVSPKPNLFALLIGVSEYYDESLTLDYAASDAEAFSEALRRQEGHAFARVYPTVLADQDATKGMIEAALDALKENADVTDNDVTVIFFAGHGVKLTGRAGADRAAELYLVSHNANMTRVPSTTVSATRLVEAVRGRVGRKFVFLDACFSNFSEQGGLGLFDMQGMANMLGGSDIRAEVFSSSTGSQYSFEREEWKHGAFTKALLEGMSGSADYPPQDGRITNDELDLYVKRRVREMTEGRQTPTYTAAGGVEFPLAFVTGSNPTGQTR
jgi:hypothetical protein